jgi:hypothetical protein
MCNFTHYRAVSANTQAIVRGRFGMRLQFSKDVAATLTVRVRRLATRDLAAADSGVLRVPAAGGDGVIYRIPASADKHVIAFEVHTDDTTAVVDKYFYAGSGGVVVAPNSEHGSLLSLTGDTEGKRTQRVSSFFSTGNDFFLVVMPGAPVATITYTFRGSKVSASRMHV